MAGDIIDSMLSGLFKLVGWVLGGILNLFMSLIVGIFKGIASLFKKEPSDV